MQAQRSLGGEFWSKCGSWSVRPKAEATRPRGPCFTQPPDPPGRVTSGKALGSEGDPGGTESWQLSGDCSSFRPSGRGTWVVRLCAQGRSPKDLEEFKGASPADRQRESLADTQSVVATEASRSSKEPKGAERGGAGERWQARSLRPGRTSAFALSVRGL